VGGVALHCTAFHPERKHFRVRAEETPDLCDPSPDQAKSPSLFICNPRGQAT